MPPSPYGKGRNAEKALIEEDIAELQSMNKDSMFFRQNYEELLSQHPEQWVGIFNQEVVGVSADMDELLQELKRRGIPLDQVLFEYMTEEEPHLVVH
jgi:hypothetical protein